MLIFILIVLIYYIFIIIQISSFENETFNVEAKIFNHYCCDVHV